MTRSSRARLAAIALALATASLAPCAFGAEPAEPTAADAASAQALYKEGKALREKGDLEGAVTKLRAAYALVETPILAVELAHAYEKLGKLVEARELCLGVSRIAKRRNESAKATAARQEAADLAKTFDARLAKLTIKLPEGAPPLGELAIDGVVVPLEAATTARILNPGAHTANVRFNDGRTASADTTLKEGEAKDLPIEVPPAPVVAVSEPKVRAPVHDDGTRRILLVGGIALAAAGTALGSVTGILSLGKASSAKDQCRGNTCPPAAQDDIDSGKTFGTISTVSFIVAGVGAAAIVVALVLPRSAKATTQVGFTRSSFEMAF